MSAVYKQLVMWKNTYFHDSIDQEAFESDFLKLNGVRVKFAEQINIGADKHILFYIHRDDIAKFSYDVEGRSRKSFYWRESNPKLWNKLPKEILEKYPPLWSY